MSSIFVGYLAVTGGITAGLQVARGLVRASARVVEGDRKAALAEAVGGFVAPVTTALAQGLCLGHDALAAARALVGEPDLPHEMFFAAVARAKKTQLATADGTGPRN